MLIDFTDSFVSDPVDGKHCMTSYCTNAGHTVHFLKVFCNTTDSSVRGVCGKYWLIDWLYSYWEQDTQHSVIH
jgi:hypothetical protein